MQAVVLGKVGPRFSLLNVEDTRLGALERLEGTCVPILSQTAHTQLGSKLPTKSASCTAGAGDRDSIGRDPLSQPGSAAQRGHHSASSRLPSPQLHRPAQLSE